MSNDNNKKLNKGSNSSSKGASEKPKSKNPVVSRFKAPKGVLSAVGLQKALRLDAKALGGPEYVKANAATYSLLCNMWYSIIITETGLPELGRGLLDLIYEQGLVKTIDDAAKAADEVLSNMEAEYSKVETLDPSQQVLLGNFVTLRAETDCLGMLNPVHRYWDVVLYNLYAKRLEEVTPEHEGNCDQMLMRNYIHSALLCTRFPKRFSPASADKVLEESIRDFLAMENRNKLLQRKEQPRILDARISTIIGEMLRYYKPVKDGYFSTGSQLVGNQQKAKSLGKKLMHAAGDFQIQPREYTNFRCIPAWKIGVCTELDYVMIHVVPKNYKTGRVIGQEDSTKAWHAQSVNLALREATLRSKWKNYFHYIDQEPNMEACQLGVFLDTPLATVDQSKASDSITWSFVCRFFPDKVVKDLRRVRPRYAICDGRERQELQMAFSSGHACTATLETIVFLAIDIATAELCACYQGRPKSDYVDPDRIVVYNDDQVVPCDIVDTLVEVHRWYGLITNYEKSYWHGPYREACGTEYLFGLPVHHDWFPRHTFVWDREAGPETYAALTKLQEKAATRELRDYMTQLISDWVVYCGQRPTFSRVLCEDTADIISDYRTLVPASASMMMRKGKVIQIILPPNVPITGDIDNHCRYKGFSQYDQCCHPDTFLACTLPWIARKVKKAQLKYRTLKSTGKVRRKDHVPTPSEPFNEIWDISLNHDGSPLSVGQLSCIINRELGLGFVGREALTVWSYLTSHRDIDPEGRRRASLYIIQWRCVTKTGRPGKYIMSPDISFNGISHLGIQASYGKSALKDNEIKEHLDLYRYMHFLKEGPTFDDPLSELLGVSSTPVSSSEMWNGSTIEWKTRVER